VGLHVLALYDLAERALAENVQNQVLVAVLCTEPVVNVENVVIVLVVISVVVGGLARLCEYAAGVVGRLVSELGVADVVRIEQVSRQLPQGLQSGK
jgi:hypothetical protein